MVKRDFLCRFLKEMGYAPNGMTVDSALMNEKWEMVQMKAPNINLPPRLYLPMNNDLPKDELKDILITPALYQLFLDFEIIDKFDI